MGTAGTRSADVPVRVSRKKEKEDFGEAGTKRNDGPPPVHAREETRRSPREGENTRDSLWWALEYVHRVAARCDRTGPWRKKNKT